MTSPAIRLALASLVAPLALAALAACSSKAATGSADVDGGVGANRPLGAACDPTLASPCTQPADVCSAGVCDAKTLRCTIVASDAGACGSTQPGSCLIDADCAGGACVNGLCFTTCLTGSDCDGGTCTTVCPGDAAASGCKAYCTYPFGH